MSAGILMFIIFSHCVFIGRDNLFVDPLVNLRLEPGNTSRAYFLLNGKCTLFHIKVYL